MAGLLPKHEYFSESPNRTSKSTIAYKLNARIQIVGMNVTFTPCKSKKKVFEKIYAFDSNDYNNKITIKEK